jgi:hypothetical protein
LAALNALLAEHSLGLVELVPENPFASQLKQGVLSAFRAGTSSRFDEARWVKEFYYQSRIVQLNFVAFGFNELGMRPMLPGENWQRVLNPLVIRNIESKLDKASQTLARRHGVTVHLRNSKLSITDWGVADLSDRPSPPSSPQSRDEATSPPNLIFKNELPDTQSNKPTDVIRSNVLTIVYYENARTRGEMTLGAPPLYKYPQCAVVGRQDSELIVRLEESAFGTSMLCIIEPSGVRSNLGKYSRVARNIFIEKVMEIAREKLQGTIKYERPSSETLDARIWGEIKRFITAHGVSEFRSNRLHLVVGENYRVSVDDPALAKNILFSVPLSELNIDLDAVQKGEPFLSGEANAAARSVMERLLRSGL